MFLYDNRSLWDEPKDFQKEALATYFKVTFVRNPLVRLVSGYRNKIVRVPKGHYQTQIQVSTSLTNPMLITVLVVRNDWYVLF